MKHLGQTAGVAALGAGGCLAVYANQSLGGYPFIYTIRQLIAFVIGLVLFLLISNIPFRKMESKAVILGALSAAALCLVLVFGSSINGMKGWFTLYPGYTIQPSELVKGPYVLLLSVIACRTEWSEWKRFLLLSGLCILFSGLVILEPDFGSASLFFLIAASIIFLTGFHARYVIAILGGSLCACAFFLTLHPYAMRRLIGFLDPGLYGETSAWHLLQFRYAIANGGLTGADDLSAMWSCRYLPLAHSDSAFAAIAESSGMAGGLIVMTGFLLGAWVFRKMALAASSRTRQIFIFSAGLFPVLQGTLHIAVNTTILPTTGIPLPLFSSGGSSLLSVMILLGMIVSAAEPEDSGNDSIKEKEP